jgi:hemoglobin-like flavoprotein
MQTLGHVVDTLDTNRDESEQTLLLLGAKHGMIEGFKEDYFSVYSSCMIDTWESVIGEEFIIEVKESWEALCVFITRFMREGYALYQQETANTESDNEAAV